MTPNDWRYYTALKTRSCLQLHFSFLFCSMDGGELFSRIQDRGDQAFTERGNKHMVTWLDIHSDI